MTSEDRGQSAPREAWGLAPGARVWSGGHHEAAKRLLLALLTDVTRPRHGLIDVGFLAPAAADEAVYFAAKMLPRLKAPANIWIICPTADSKHAEDFDGTSETLCTAMGELGLALRKTVEVDDEFVSLLFQAGAG